MKTESFIQSGARRMSIPAIRERAARAAGGLEQLGVASGDVVALMLRNDFAFFEVSLAAATLGAYSTPINWHYTKVEAEYVLKNSTAKILVVHADIFRKIQEILPEEIVVFVVETPAEIGEVYEIADGERTVPKGARGWSAWLEGFAPYHGAPRPAPGAVIYTSGTTGSPKGVKRNAPNSEQAALSADIRERAFGFTPYRLDPGSIRTLICGPLYHSTPNVYALICFNLGANIVLQAKFEPEDFLRLVQDQRITHVHMVPIMFNRLLKLPEGLRAKYDVSSLRAVSHGAAPCAVEPKMQMIDWLGPIITEYYGSTETSIMTLCDTAEWLSHPGSVGRPVEATDLKILGENGEVLPPGEVGTVAAITRGIADFTYLGDEAKRRSIDRNGRIAPGDLGYLDVDGFLHLCDRSSEIIISGGVNIYPAEIEAELQRIPAVADCAVVGAPDEDYGEQICAYIQLQPGAVLTEVDIVEALRERLAKFKIPRSFRFQQDLPREDSGKIFKKKLRADLWKDRQKNI